MRTFLWHPSASAGRYSSSNSTKIGSKTFEYVFCEKRNPARRRRCRHGGRYSEGPWASGIVVQEERSRTRILQCRIVPVAELPEVAHQTLFLHEAVATDYAGVDLPLTADLPDVIARIAGQCGSAFGRDVPLILEIKGLYHHGDRC